VSSFLYRLGRLAAQRRLAVLAIWLVVLMLAGGGALFNKGTDDTFEIPGTQSQDALDYLGRVFPETSGTSAQLVIVVPPGQDVAQLAAAQTADAVETIKKTDQVASVINPFDPNPTGQTISGEQPRTQPAISEDHRAAIVTAQLTVSLADVKQDTRNQLTDIGEHLATAIGHGATVQVGGPAFSNPVPKLSPTEGIGLLIAFVVLLLVFRSLIAAGMPLLTAVLGVGISVALIYTATLVTPVSSTAPMLAVMLGLAVGIDYALFLLSRHRDQLAEGLDVEESIARATATAGSAVIFAGLTVLIALLGLSVAGIAFLTTMGLAGRGGGGHCGRGRGDVGSFADVLRRRAAAAPSRQTAGQAWPAACAGQPPLGPAGDPRPAAHRRGGDRRSRGMHNSSLEPATCVAGQRHRRGRHAGSRHL